MASCRVRWRLFPSIGNTPRPPGSLRARSLRPMNVNGVRDGQNCQRWKQSCHAHQAALRFVNTKQIPPMLVLTFIGATRKPPTALQSIPPWLMDTFPFHRTHRHAFYSPQKQPSVSDEFHLHGNDKHRSGGQGCREAGSPESLACQAASCPDSSPMQAKRT